MSVSRVARVRTMLRMLFMQAAWNFERLQNLGWAWCMQPGLNELYPDPAERAKALRRHLELFNTHPYMAGYVAGAALRAEAEVAAGTAEPARVAALKSGLAPALAAMGDSFFWATLRPSAAMLAVAWLWLAPHPWQLASPFVFLLAYNLPSLWLRLRSVEHGWNQGEQVAMHIVRMRLPAVAEGLRIAALILAGGLAGSLARIVHPATGEAVPLLDNFAFLGAGLGMLLLLRLALRPAAILLFIVVGTLVLAVTVPH